MNDSKMQPSEKITDKEFILTLAVVTAIVATTVYLIVFTQLGLVICVGILAMPIIFLFIAAIAGMAEDIAESLDKGEK